MSHSEDVSEPVHGAEPRALDSQGDQTLVSLTPGVSPQRQPHGLHQEKERAHLFKGVVFYLNPFLGKGRVEELETILCTNGALKALKASGKDDGKKESGTSKPTHIITDDLDFPDYEHATARGIHIVKPKWVVKSVAFGKLQSPENFSADPAMIFTGIVLTTTGLPEYDRQVICNAVQDYGGVYSPEITPSVTHMIAIAAAGEKYCYVMEHSEMAIKIVLPHWFQLCCNLRRLMPETIYLFPDPPMLEPDYAFDQAEQTQGSAPQLYSNTVKSVTSFLLAPSHMQTRFLEGFYLLLGDDLNILPERRVKIEEKIVDAGGVLVSGYASDMVDVVICRFRVGDLYVKASKDGKIVASADWLLYVLQTGEFTSPKSSLLHYPIPPEPIPGMSSLVMTISNYTGNIREYLKRMIVAVGATYKPTLSSQSAPEPTTHLICGNASGDKYERGHEWNVKVVNHLWLEDCFQAWSLQSETKSRYTLFPIHNQLSLVFGAPVLSETLEDWIGSDERQESFSHPQAAAITGQLLENIPVKDRAASMESPPTEEERQGVIAESFRSKDGVGSGHASPARSNSQSHAPSNTTPKKPLSSPRPLRSETVTTPAVSAPTSPTSSQSAVTFQGSKDRDSSPFTSEKGPALGSVRVVSRKRGAALQASKALQKIVPDMNNFQDELRDEKKSSKKKKKHIIVEEREDQVEGMDLDEAGEAGRADHSPSAPKKAIASPVKRRRISMGSVGERSTPGGSDEDEEFERESNTAESRATPKRAKRGARTEKDAAAMEVNGILPDQAVGGSKPRRVRYISTGVKDQSAAQVKALKALGIMPTTAVEKCTHLVATSIARTGKFLIALLQGKVIVHEDWLQACIDANAILDEEDFRIEDVANQKKFGMNLYESLEQAREKKVFENCVFYLSPSINKDMPGLKNVIEAGGGKASTLLHTGLGFLKDRVVKARKENMDKGKTTLSGGRDQQDGLDEYNTEKGNASEEDDDSEEESQSSRKDEIVAVVSSEKDRDMWRPILDAGAHVYSHDLVSVSVLTQRLDLSETHALA